MYDNELEILIKGALASGGLNDKNKKIIFKKAKEKGVDLDELELVIAGRLADLKEKQSPTTTKSSKLGQVNKCPNCGAIVPPLATKCPDCSLEFRGVEANSSSKKLAEELKIAREKGDKQAPVIRNFPVPATKEDLFEFAITMQSKMTIENDALRDAYSVKAKECIDRIRILFPDDTRFKQILEGYSKSVRQYKRKKRRNATVKILQKVMEVLWNGIKLLGKGIVICLRQLLKRLYLILYFGVLLYLVYLVFFEDSHFLVFLLINWFIWGGIVVLYITLFKQEKEQKNNS
ncbi:MAG: zinc ribbon domain-containing protein [Bacteroidales bacterium]|nr:zinc ribbon domain-containing protein [Bacteroidales bacterium]